MPPAPSATPRWRSRKKATRRSRAARRPSWNCCKRSIVSIWRGCATGRWRGRKEAVRLEKRNKLKTDADHPSHRHLRSCVMIFGIPTATFILIHVIISLIGIATGFVVLYGLLTNRLFAGWTALFLVFNVLTDLTGYPIPPFGFDPPRV